MRTTLALDGAFMRTAQELTGLSGKAALVREALKQHAKAAADTSQ